MKTDVCFLRETAEKLKQRRYSHDLPMPQWKETIFCQVEFLVTADEIENVHVTPRVERAVIPKVRAPREEPVLVERRSLLPEEEFIAQAHAPKHIEEPKSTIEKTTLKTKDLTFQETLILKDLKTVETANVYEDVEIEPKREVLSKTLKTKKDIVSRPDRAPSTDKPANEISLSRLIKLQRGRCAYCFRGFGERVFSELKIVTLHATREHFIPESIGGKILFAACQMCNFFKRDYLFDSLADCRKYLAEEWKRSGYKDTNKHFIANAKMFSFN